MVNIEVSNLAEKRSYHFHEFYSMRISEINNFLKRSNVWLMSVKLSFTSKIFTTSLAQKSHG